MSREDYNHFAELPNLPRVIGRKRKTPAHIAYVEPGNCTGCLVCVPFCPVDCIEPVPPGTYSDVVIQPVRVRHQECIGCELCVKACRQLTWDAVRMMTVEAFETLTGVIVEGPRYGWSGVAPDASTGPPASEVFDKLQSEKKISFER